jgi:uncharacterized damage-inducible protein DinB
VDSLAHLRQLYAYEAWAQDEVLASLLAHAAPPERALRLHDHLLGAGFLWLARIRGEASPLAVWPELGAAERRSRATELSRAWAALLAALGAEELARVVRYRNSKGEPWTSSVESILTHVVLHAAYHRGQIASALREAGGTPAYVDYIHAVRSGALAARGSPEVA